jgi:NADH:ubiquinone oxidoreductase subunit 6 (subunit J)
MNKRTSVGLIVAGLLLVVLVGGIITTDFNPAFDSPQGLPTFTTSHDSELDIFDENNELKENSLPYAIFEKYGFVLIPLAILMFGAMVGGVVISKEEVEE